MKIATASLIGIALVIPAAGALAEPGVKVLSASAPLTITACRNDGNHRYSDVVNRTRHTLKSYEVEWDAYDAHGKNLGGASLEYQLDPALATGEQGSYFEDVSVEQLGVPSAHAVSRFTCRVVSATFTDGKKWTSGKHWAEALLPMPAARTADSGATGAAPQTVGAPGGSGAALHIEVVNAWNDNVQGTLYVHDTILIHGAAANTTVQSRDFVLTMQLANGGQKSYPGMSQAAPTYSKINPMSQTPGVAFEVDPNMDLGSLGALVVPAQGAVKVTVTFAILETVANPAANRSVTMAL